MAKDKKADSSIRIMMGSNKDIPVQIMKHSYPNITQCMINFILELARLAGKLNQVAIVGNGEIMLTEEFNNALPDEFGEVKLIDPEEMQNTTFNCQHCNKVIKNRVCVKFNLDDFKMKVDLSSLLHMVMYHNAIIPMPLFKMVFITFAMSIPYIRPISEWSKEEMVEEIIKLRAVVSNLTNPHNTATVQTSPSVLPTTTEIVTTSETATETAVVSEDGDNGDDDDDDDSDEAELIESDEDDDEDDNDEEDGDE